ncbi:superfamily II DNA/RNA helicase [Alloprevotella rava]|uniref:Superfamily II DNA/RNA helicase n=1 Tax=Alloprevotella rava TaxID=671218 RepID=A0A7W5UG04_9BACT|nr:superfamily II DNA/RNA helicase [Alloprevotella rava]
MKENEDIYFEDLALSDDVLDALYDMRFEKCTPVQARCIPTILEGKDIIGIAQTGTGKTAAYLLPILTLLKREPHPAEAINCLIMAPTRELAQQIDQALQGFGYYVSVNGIAVYGGNDGVRFEQEKRSLKQGADIVIATPGRLLTHLDLGNLDLSHTTHLILDEADRMLDMGFSDDILKIVKQLPEKRQTILFSATMPDTIDKFARSIMHNPEEIRLAVSKPAEKIQQSIYVCRETDKNTIIRHLFKQCKPERVIIFCSSKQKVKELHILLKRAHFNCEAMHSDLLQQQRDEVMLKFKAGHTDILVATDIVARGIDINDIQMVINYDAPRDAEDYVHRIGRTARAGRNGIAVTLVGEKDLFALHNIEKLLKEKLARTPLPEGLKDPEKQRGKGRNTHNRKRNKSRCNQKSNTTDEEIIRKLH